MAISAALSVRVTDGVASLLEEAASCSSVPETVRADARKLRGIDSISWDDLKSVVEAYREANPGKAIYLHQLCSRQDICLHSPMPKEKNPELQARLARLQEELENKRYADMVADITTAERKAEEMRNSILPTSRLQLSFGAHVIVTMFTFWAVSYYGSKYYLHYDELWAGLTGALGLTVGLLVETLLLIIRSNRPVPLEERMPELFDPAKVKEAFEAAAELKKTQKAQNAKGGKGKRRHQQQQQGQANRGGEGTAPSGAEGKKER